MTAKDVDSFLKAINKNPDSIKTNSFKLMCLCLEMDGLKMKQLHAGIDGFTANVEYQGEGFSITIRPEYKHA